MILTSKLPNKVISIKPWTIKQEKDALLSIDETSSLRDKIDLLYSILIQDTKSLSSQEKLFVLLDTKTKISSNTIQLTYTCEECKQMTETTVDIAKSIEIQQAQEYILEFKSCFIKIQYAESLKESVVVLNDLSTMQSITDINVISKYIENLEITEYDDLAYFHSLLEKPFSFKGTGNCLICNHKMNYSPSDEDLINTVVFITLKDYYTLLVDLKPKGFSIAEIDNLMPFELDLIVQTVNSKNNKKHGELDA